MPQSEITNEEEHKAALKRVEELMDIPLGSLEADELNTLVDLIEKYEEEHYGW